MLLQADRHLVQGASAVTINAGTVPEAGSSFGTGRDPEDSARALRRPRLADHDTWLVGLRFHADGRPLWLYYVVDGAVDTHQAVRTAARRAHGDHRRAARGGVQAAADRVEVQRIVCDAIGRCTLAPAVPPSRP
ncbi:hypothetical protein [Streptomyces sp. NPDC004589]|uniref:hypothetical protein n=1 Tax=unclassified Streptomyces TaxID=2593676 RepID=UPI0033BD1EF1